MKQTLLFLSISFISQSVFSQVLPRDLNVTWKVMEANDKVIEINYKLDRVDDNGFYKVIVRGFVDDRPIMMASLRGDVGPSVRVGKNKSILWQWDRDVTEISGELKFVVTQDETAEARRQKSSPGETHPEVSGLPLLGHPGIFLGVPAGIGLTVTGLLSLSGAKSDWDAEAIKTREIYNPLNSKYKTGQILALAGGAVLAGGIIWYIVENSKFKGLVSNNNIKINPGYVTGDQSLNRNVITNQLGITLTHSF